MKSFVYEKAFFMQEIENVFFNDLTLYNLNNRDETLLGFSNPLGSTVENKFNNDIVCYP